MGLIGEDLLMSESSRHPPVSKPFVPISEVVDWIIDDLESRECEQEPTPMTSSSRDSEDA